MLEDTLSSTLHAPIYDGHWVIDIRNFYIQFNNVVSGYEGDQFFWLAVSTLQV